MSEQVAPAPCVGDCIAAAVVRLQQQGISGARLDAEVLLAFVLRVTRAVLFTYPERVLTPVAYGAFQVLLERRCKAEPVAYLIGEREFFGRRFVVDKRVLIPRPETEHAVEALLAVLPEGRPQRVLDVGTGSGCLAVTLACERASWSMVALDSSRVALQVAQENVLVHGVGDRVQCCAGDLFASHFALPQQLREEPFDAVIANPPYVACVAQAQLPRDVVAYEPHGALFAEDDGMAALLAVLQGAALCLKPRGFLVMEFGAGQHIALDSWIRQQVDSWQNRTWYRDLQGRVRGVVMMRTPAACEAVQEMQR